MWLAAYRNGVSPHEAAILPCGTGEAVSEQRLAYKYIVIGDSHAERDPVQKCLELQQGNATSWRDDGFRGVSAQYVLSRPTVRKDDPNLRNAMKAGRGVRVARERGTYRSAVSTGAILGCIAVAVSSASAQVGTGDRLTFNLCNSGASRSVDVAVVHPVAPRSRAHRSVGWYTVEPGRCRELALGQAGQHYFAFAIDEGLSGTLRRRIGGGPSSAGGATVGTDLEFCVLRNADFRIEGTLAELASCDDPDTYEVLPFNIVVTPARGGTRATYRINTDNVRLFSFPGTRVQQYQWARRYQSGTSEVRQDLPRARRIFEHWAEQGYAPAQYSLALMYETARGAEQNYGEAHRLYRLAAAQGYAPAETAIGFFHFNGLGIPADQAQAIRWYRRAADRGYAQAQYNLGHMHENGQGVARNVEDAVRWYRLAAAQGHEGAQAALQRLSPR